MKRTGRLVPLILSAVWATASAAQSVTVTRPPAPGDPPTASCTKGQACLITWTVSGQPGSKVILELMDKAAPTVARLIASDVPIGNLQYSWTVPNDVAAGQYRVQVRVYGAPISDIGNVFTIKAKSGLQLQPAPSFRTPVVTRKPGFNLPPGAGNAITITYPANMVEWELNHPYTLRWTEENVPDAAFDIDLHTGAGTHVEQLLSGAAKPEGQYSWSFEVKPWCNLVDGATYRIHIKSWTTGKVAISGPIRMFIRTRKLVENIPVQVENANIYISNTGGVLGDCSRQIPPGKARAGYDFSTFHGNSSFHVFRVRLTFDLSRFNGMNGEVESAKLITGDLQGCPGNERGFCGGNLFALGAAEAASWKTFQTYGNAFSLTGWSAPFNPTGYDITAAVRDWLKGTKPNLGLAMVSANEVMAASEGKAKACVSFFKPIMYVTFIEKPPCGSQ